MKLCCIWKSCPDHEVLILGDPSLLLWGLWDPSLLCIHCIRYQVQAPTALCTTGQSVERWVTGAKNRGLIGKASRLRRWWTAVAAKSLQLCPTLCNPKDSSPPGSSVPYIYTAAAAAKLLQLCPTLCNPIDGSPPGILVPGILQARTLEWVAISFSNAWKWKVKVKSLSRVQLLATSWTAAYQAPLSMGFSRQEVPSPLSQKSNAPKFGFWASFKSSLQWHSFSRGSSRLTDWTQVSCLEGRFLHCRQILYQLSYKGCPLSLGIATSSTEYLESWRLLLKLVQIPNFQTSLKASFFYRANGQRWQSRVRKVMSCCKYFLVLVKTLKGMC